VLGKVSVRQSEAATLERIVYIWSFFLEGKGCAVAKIWSEGVRLINSKSVESRHALPRLKDKLHLGSIADQDDFRVGSSLKLIDSKCPSEPGAEGKVMK
jgi:hypothetical protein